MKNVYLNISKAKASKEIRVTFTIKDEVYQFVVSDDNTIKAIMEFIKNLCEHKDIDVIYYDKNGYGAWIEEVANEIELKLSPLKFIKMFR